MAKYEEMLKQSNEEHDQMIRKGQEEILILRRVPKHRLHSGSKEEFII